MTVTRGEGSKNLKTDVIYGSPLGVKTFVRTLIAVLSRVLEICSGEGVNERVRGGRVKA